MNAWYIASIVLGSLTIAVSFLCFIVPHRKVNLLFRLIFDALNIVNCICIFYATNTNAILIALVCDSIAIVRDIIFYFRKKGNWVDHIIWLLLFNALYLLSLIWTWSGPIVLLPAIANVFNTTALFIYKKKLTRIVTLFGQICFITYYCLLLAQSDLLTLLNLIASAMMFVSAIIGLVVLFVREKQRNNTNNEKII